MVKLAVGTLNPATKMAPAALKQRWGPVSKALRAVYTAPTVDAAERQIEEFKTAWGGQYPMIIRTWEAAWEQFTPFLAFPPEIRRVIYTTNMIESMNARFRQAVRRRGHFPSDQAAPRCSTWSSATGERTGPTWSARPPAGSGRSSSSPCTSATASPTRPNDRTRTDHLHPQGFLHSRRTCCGVPPRVTCRSC